MDSIYWSVRSSSRRGGDGVKVVNGGRGIVILVSSDNSLLLSKDFKNFQFNNGIKSGPFFVLFLCPWSTVYKLNLKLPSL